MYISLLKENIFWQQCPLQNHVTEIDLVVGRINQSIYALLDNQLDQNA